MLADNARGFLDEAAPVRALRDLRDAGRTHDPALWRRICDMGWAGVLIPEDAGGADMGHAAAGVLAHEMGRTLACTPFLSSAVIAATILRRIGGERAKSAMAAIAAGELTHALAIDEAHKFAPEATAMTAERHGNGFRLSGKKCFVVDGGFADRLLVLARTGEEGLTLFDLPADRAGITRTAQGMIDSRDAARIAFENVEATGDDVLGQVGGAMTALKPGLEAGQAALAAEMSGLAAGAFDMTVGYLKDRKQFGQPIGSFQALQHRAAHLWCEIEVTASAILNAGRVLDTDPNEATLAVSLAKARATSTAQLAVMEGVQMHGGIGMTDEYDMGFYMKRARVGSEWLGDYGYHAEQVAALRGM
ncbi:acyl-CoA dehydrogenase [Paracoccus methylarcula]|uniref:Acyl-CoA dehydrogenase n=2 Tax=Paracoccus methylarcula TaxID=72022 RepID=A0A422QVU4_9RHOB|nr:acyl-CoA dehydrogenase [Paracoccus methylarcula]